MSGMSDELPGLRQSRQQRVLSPKSFLAGSGDTAEVKTISKYGAGVSASTVKSAQHAFSQARNGFKSIPTSESIIALPHLQAGGRLGIAGSGCAQVPLEVSAATTASPKGLRSTIPQGLPTGKGLASPSSPGTPSHLEYVGLGPSLTREAYSLPSQSPHGSAADRDASVDIFALQDATTGVLMRYLNTDEPVRSAGGAAEQNTRTQHSSPPTVTSRSGDENPDASSTVMGSLLVRATPMISAAMLETGVDDRITPFLLDQLIHRYRRRGRATAPVASRRQNDRHKAQVQHQHRKVDAPARVASPGSPHGRRKEQPAEVQSDGAAAELPYHEPPSMVAAYDTFSITEPANDDKAPLTSLQDNENPPTAAAPPVGTVDALADVIADYANELSETTGAPPPVKEKGGRGGTAVKLPFATTMTSTEYAHIAAAVSGNDGAFVRQLVGYYSARADAELPSSARRREIQLGDIEALSRSSARTRMTRHEGRIMSLGGAASVHNSFPASSPMPEFCLLDGVLSVSREYIAQRCSVGKLGLSTSALSEQRRFLLDRLTSLSQTRIPDTWWVTSLPYLGRLPMASLATNPTKAAVSDVRSRHPMLTSMPNVGASSSKVGAEISSGGASRGSKNSDVWSSHAAEDVWNGSEQPLHMTMTANGTDTAVKEAIRQVSVVGTGAANNAALAGGGPLTSGGSALHSVIFPAARPVERSQTYLLAEVLDRMLRDPSHPRWLALLSDPQVARYILADDEDEHADEIDCKKENDDPLDNDLWGPLGEQRLMAYTDAATHVLDILDTGIAEVVRQVASHCAERGALLDMLRQSVMDIASSHIHLLKQVKQQAHRDAFSAQQLRKENMQLSSELGNTTRALQELQKAHNELLLRVEPLQRKSDRLDELMARVAARARRFETSHHDEHTALLQALEEFMAQSAGSALDNFLTEMHDLQVRHTDGDGASTGSGAANADGAPLLSEMPSVTVARSQALEQRQTMERLYTDSYQLLRSLQATVEATNELCGPLYDKMILKDVSPAAKVATSRWALVARAVGTFERDKHHRQRVYEVFIEYCTAYRHKIAAKANADGENKKPNFDRGLSDAEVASKRMGVSYGEAFLVQDDEFPNPSDHVDDGTNLSLGDDLDSPSSKAASGSIRAEVHAKVHKALQNDAEINRAASAAVGAREQVVAGAIITQEDLEAMGATDCTLDEVNAFFKPDFDAHKYLRVSWEQYVQARQLQEQQGSIAVPGGGGGDVQGKSGTADRAYTLRLPDVLQMLSDVQATLTEVTVRMKALTSSSVLQAGLRPQLEPPSHPEQPCPLCSRRDTCELDRQRRREAMARIARDLQSKMDAVEAKCRAALTERDEALGEVRRLRMELRHTAPTSPGRTSSPVGGPLQPTASSPEVSPRTGQANHVRRHTSSPQNGTSESGTASEAPLLRIRQGGDKSAISPLGIETSGTGQAVDTPAKPAPGALQLADAQRINTEGDERPIAFMSGAAKRASHITFNEDCDAPPNVCNDSDQGDDLSMPSYRRTTAVMVPKPAPPAMRSSIRPRLSSSSFTAVSTPQRARRKSEVGFLVDPVIDTSDEETKGSGQEAVKTTKIQSDGEESQTPSKPEAD